MRDALGTRGSRWRAVVTAAALGVLLLGACNTDTAPRLDAPFNRNPPPGQDGGQPKDGGSSSDAGAERDAGRDASEPPEVDAAVPPVDRDGDRVPDALDRFPDHADEAHDNDGDGVGDNADLDDDNDSVTDSADVHPYDPRRCGDSDRDRCDDCSSGRFAPRDDGADLDADGRCDSGDRDDDGDGVLDGDDAGVESDAGPS